jgi:predicted small secreted protein
MPSLAARGNTATTPEKGTMKHATMNTPTKRIVALLCITALLAIVGLGCNTAHGFGKDVSNAGEGIQEGTN